MEDKLRSKSSSERRRTRLATSERTAQVDDSRHATDRQRSRSVSPLPVARSGRSRAASSAAPTALINADVLSRSTAQDGLDNPDDLPRSRRRSKSVPRMSSKSERDTRPDWRAERRSHYDTEGSGDEGGDTRESSFSIPEPKRGHRERSKRSSRQREEFETQGTVDELQPAAPAPKTSTTGNIGGWFKGVGEFIKSKVAAVEDHAHDDGKAHEELEALRRERKRLKRERRRLEREQAESVAGGLVGDDEVSRPQPASADASQPLISLSLGVYQCPVESLSPDTKQSRRRSVRAESTGRDPGQQDPARRSRSRSRVERSEELDHEARSETNEPARESHSRHKQAEPSRSRRARSQAMCTSEDKSKAKDQDMAHIPMLDGASPPSPVSEAPLRQRARSFSNAVEGGLRDITTTILKAADARVAVTELQVQRDRQEVTGSSRTSRSARPGLPTSTSTSNRRSQSEVWEQRGSTRVPCHSEDDDSDGEQARKALPPASRPRSRSRQESHREPNQERTHRARQSRRHLQTESDNTGGLVEGDTTGEPAAGQN